jgi:N-methylhydantoinase B
VTLVSRTALGYAVSRAHHADVGGIEPASLPAFSHTLDQEGVILPPQLLTDDVLERFVEATRQPEERRGDLRAQLSAHRLADQRLGELCARRGSERVAAAMDELYAYSERMVRAAVAQLPDGRGEAEDVVEAVDSDLRIRCAVEIAGDAIRIDFTGTAPQYGGNLNCPLPVTKSACYFVVRCLTEPDLPASGGAFAPVSVTAPQGCLINAKPPAAVVAGNTETSSRIVDVVFSAFSLLVPVPAAGQGTMNNLALGNDGFTYYETVGGGQGACPDAGGPSGVHVAMSNTLVTPTEAIELEYPLRVERWELRRGSGGEGDHRGGDGVVRELRVLDDCRLSVLAERRRHGPPGRDGGEDGARGRTLINDEEQPPKLTRQLHAGDVVRVETPGGGGYGPPQ